MSFPRYPAYKPSGVEWLGEVPEHWEEKHLKSVTSINDEVLSESVSTDHEIEYVDISSVSLANGIERTESVIFGDAPSRARRIPRDGDVLVSTVRTYLKAIAPVVSPPSNLVASTGFAVVRPQRGIHPGYLKYALQEEHFIQQVISRSTGVSYPAINASDIARIPLSLPKQSEQLAIATFLDHETAKIDALITEQQHLIELLQEKRQAVISHAVTKGLNPDAPMKDSGVEWLGEVPEHWTLKRLKHLSPNLTVGIVVNPSEYVSDEGLPFVYGGDIREGVIDWENSRRIAPAMSDKQAKTRLRSGDLLMVRVGAPGITAVVPAECEGGNCASVMLIRQGSFSSQWLCFTLNTRIVRFQVEVVQYGAAQEQFNISHAVNFWLPVPPRPEQDRIATFLLSEHEKAQGLILQAQNAVSLLQERRSALISAAVTGQIDVRGLVPEASAA
jgi:type I restriction enzyme S subunit